MKISYKKIMSLIISILFVFVPCYLSFFKDINAESDESRTTNVSNFEELKKALEGRLYDTIIVNKTIVLDGNKSIDLNGKILSVQNTYLDDNGFIRNGGCSEYSVFTVNKGSTILIKNGTIKGGYVNSKSGGINNYGILTLEHVNFTKGYSGLFSTSSSITVCRECNFFRNAKSCGGGLVCDGGKIVIDGCSFYDNHSLFSSRGGGAIEVSNNSCAYINNTVIANNTSAEIGGGINVRTKSKLYIINSTVSGNVTTKKLRFGGGIGNNDGHIYGINTLFASNFYDNGKITVPSDVGLYNGRDVNLYGCLYGAVVDDGGDASNKIMTNDQNYVTTEKLMSNYRNDCNFSMESGYTIPYERPVLVSKDENNLSLYAPCAPDTIAVNGAKYDTYFDYSDLYNIKIGYSIKGDSEIHSIGDLDVPCANAKVSTLFEGGERKNEIGASGSLNKKFCTIKLKEKIELHGTISGVTTYGDSYEYGTVITLSTVPYTGYHFKQWDIFSGDNSYSIKNNPCNIQLTEDIIVLPVFEVGDIYSVKFISETCSSSGGPYVVQGENYTATLVPNDMYEFADKPTVKIGEQIFGCDKDYSFEISENTGTLIIPSNIINGNIEISIECTLAQGGNGEDNQNVYNLSIEWGNMLFVYDKGYWTGTETIRSTNFAGPEPNHEDTECGIWYGMDNINNKVTIKNMSNIPITVTASVSKSKNSDILGNVEMNLKGGQDEMWTETETNELKNTLNAKTTDSTSIDTKNLILSVTGTPGKDMTTSKTGEKIGEITIIFS